MYDYMHGGNAAFEDGSKDILDLSANINPLGLPNGVRDAIVSQLPLVTGYPDSLSKELRKEIATFENVDPDWIFCGNGASEIIFRLAYYVKPKTALLPVPIFSDYERALTATGAEIYHHLLKEEQGFNPDESIVQSILRHQAEMIFICNPNNPTGVLTERYIIEEILAQSEKSNAIVAIDECFIDFVENSGAYTSKPLLERYSNLIILKAFTKTFALPGIRLGYALSGNPKIIEGLYSHGADWAVSNLAQAAGIAALQGAAKNAYLSETVSFVSKERALIKSELEKTGFVTYDSRANYVFFRNPNSFDLAGKLSEANIRIRSCGNYVGLTEDFWRVAVSTAQNNRRFIVAVSRYE